MSEKIILAHPGGSNSASFESLYHNWNRTPVYFKLAVSASYPSLCLFWMWKLLVLNFPHTFTFVNTNYKSEEQILYE